VGITTTPVLWKIPSSFFKLVGSYFHFVDVYVMNFHRLYLDPNLFVHYYCCYYYNYYHRWHYYYYYYYYYYFVSDIHVL